MSVLVGLLMIMILVAMGQTFSFFFFFVLVASLYPPYLVEGATAFLHLCTHIARFLMKIFFVSSTLVHKRTKQNVAGVCILPYKNALTKRA